MVANITCGVIDARKNATKTTCQNFYLSVGPSHPSSLTKIPGSAHGASTKQMIKCLACADPESFAIGGPTLTTLFFFFFLTDEGREDPKIL